MRASERARQLLARDEWSRADIEDARKLLVDLVDSNDGLERVLKEIFRIGLDASMADDELQAAIENAVDANWARELRNRSQAMP